MDQGLKKDIVLSSLAMRFYSFDGWTKELLDQYLIKGHFIAKGGIDALDPEYWILIPNSILDVDRLMADGHIGELRCKERWGELKYLTDLEILKYRNW